MDKLQTQAFYTHNFSRSRSRAIYAWCRLFFFLNENEFFSLFLAVSRRSERRKWKLREIRKIVTVGQKSACTLQQSRLQNELKNIILKTLAAREHQHVSESGAKEMKKKYVVGTERTSTVPTQTPTKALVVDKLSYDDEWETKIKLMN